MADGAKWTELKKATQEYAKLHGLTFAAAMAIVAEKCPLSHRAAIDEMADDARKPRPRVACK